MKMYLVPVSLTVSMMAPGALAGAGTISGASGHPAVLQLQAHTLSLQQLLEQPLVAKRLVGHDGEIFHLEDEHVCFTADLAEVDAIVPHVRELSAQGRNTGI